MINYSTSYLASGNLQLLVSNYYYTVFTAQSCAFIRAVKPFSEVVLLSCSKEGFEDAESKLMEYTELR